MNKEKTVLKFKKPEAVIFDKDGTLLSFYCFWEPVSRAAVLSVLKKYSAPMELIDRIMEKGGVIGGNVDISGVLCYGTYDEIAELIAEFFDTAGIHYEPKALAADTKAAFDESLELGIARPTCDGIADLFARLRENGIKLFVVTTDRMNATLLCLEKIGLENCFDEIITADSGIPPKPNPDAISYLQEKYSFRKDRMIMVGDTPTDVKFARAGGISVISLAENETNREILERTADAVIGKIIDIPDVVEI